MRNVLPLCLFLVAALPARLFADGNNWPQFRGAQASGAVEAKGLPETWSTTTNVVWKMDIPGSGWSSPIIWGNRVFVTSVVREGKEESPIKGLYFGGNRLTPSPDAHRWMV